MTETMVAQTNNRRTCRDGGLSVHKVGGWDNLADRGLRVHVMFAHGSKSDVLRGIKFAVYLTDLSCFSQEIVEYRNGGNRCFRRVDLPFGTVKTRLQDLFAKSRGGVLEIVHAADMNLARSGMASLKRKIEDSEGMNLMYMRRVKTRLMVSSTCQRSPLEHCHSDHILHMLYRSLV